MWLVILKPTPSKTKYAISPWNPDNWFWCKYLLIAYSPPCPKKYILRGLIRNGKQKWIFLRYCLKGHHHRVHSPVAGGPCWACTVCLCVGSQGRSVGSSCALIFLCLFLLWILYVVGSLSWVLWWLPLWSHGVCVCVCVFFSFSLLLTLCGQLIAPLIYPGLSPPQFQDFLGCHEIFCLPWGISDTWHQGFSSENNGWICVRLCVCQTVGYNDKLVIFQRNQMAYWILKDCKRVDVMNMMINVILWGRSLDTYIKCVLYKNNHT